MYLVFPLPSGHICIYEILNKLCKEAYLHVCQGCFFHESQPGKGARISHVVWLVTTFQFKTDIKAVNGGAVQVRC